MNFLCLEIKIEEQTTITQIIYWELATICSSLFCCCLLRFCRLLLEIVTVALLVLSSSFPRCFFLYSKLLLNLFWSLKLRSTILRNFFNFGNLLTRGYIWLLVAPSRARAPPFLISFLEFFYNGEQMSKVRKKMYVNFCFKGMTLKAVCVTINSFCVDIHIEKFFFGGINVVFINMWTVWRGKWQH